jgi:hypothetical protein
VARPLKLPLHLLSDEERTLAPKFTASLSIIQAAEIGIVLSIWATAITASDTVSSGILLAVASGIVCLFVFRHASQWGTTLRTTILITAAAAFLLTQGFVYLKTLPRSPNAILASQVEELKKLEALVGGKTESELREMFDFPNILKFNIALDKRSLYPTLVTTEESKEIDRVFAGGNAHLDARYGHLSKGLGGSFQFRMRPGQQSIINTTKKYADSRAELNKVSSSGTLPANIVSRVRELDQTVQENTSSLFAVLTIKLGINPRFVIDDADASSAFFGVISNAYWDQFKPLEPRAKAIIYEIRSYPGA